MTTLNDFVVTNLQQLVLDEYINRMLGSVFRKEFSNALTMTTDITLTDGDTPIQRLNCNGANRIVKVPPGADGNHPFLLINTTSSGVWTITVKSNDGTTILQTIYPSASGLVYPDGNGLYTAAISKEVALSNYLINGGFDLAQRQTPGTLTTISNDKYSADRWRISRENADLQYQRADGLSEAGLTSQYYGTFKKITNGGKFMIYQIIEGATGVALRDKTITFQAKIKASSSKTIRMAVLQLQSAGTIDSIPATFVSAWGANGVDPTLGANLAIITGAQSKSVTTSMQLFSVSVTVPSTAKNIICAIWTDSQFSANDTLSLAEAGLYTSEYVQTWSPRLIGDELCLAQRYCIAQVNASYTYNAHGFAYTTSLAKLFVSLPVEMRIVPTLIVTASDYELFDGVTEVVLTNLIIDDAGNSSKKLVALKATVSGTPLTAFRPYTLLSISGTKNIELSAEL